MTVLDHVVLILLVAIAISFTSAAIISGMVMVRIFKVLERVAKELRSLNDRFVAMHYDIQTLTSELPDYQNHLRVIGDRLTEIQHEFVGNDNEIQQAIGDLMTLILRHVVNGKGKHS